MVSVLDNYTHSSEIAITIFKTFPANSFETSGYILTYLTAIFKKIYRYHPVPVGCRFLAFKSFQDVHENDVVLRCYAEGFTSPICSMASNPSYHTASFVLLLTCSTDTSNTAFVFISSSFKFVKMNILFTLSRASSGVQYMLDIIEQYRKLTRKSSFM